MITLTQKFKELISTIHQCAEFEDRCTIENHLELFIKAVKKRDAYMIGKEDTNKEYPYHNTNELDARNRLRLEQNLRAKKSLGEE